MSERKIERIIIHYEDGGILDIYPDDVKKAQEWARVRRMLKDLRSVALEE